MTTFKQLAASIRVVAKNVTVNADTLVRKVALAIDQSLVLGTPADTGRARANWQVSVGGPATGEVTNFPAGSGDSVGVRGAAAEFALTAAIVATKGFAGGAIHISNNLPYIIPLNDGHSKQAPINFIQTAILNGIAAVRTVKLTEKPEGYGESSNG